MKDASDRLPRADPRETERLWGELSGSLLGWFRRHGASAEESEDLLQESFLRVHEGLGGVRDTSKAVGWVQSIARNLMTDHRRRARHETTGEEDPEPEAEALDESAERELAACLAPWVDGLPERYRGVLRMAELEGRRPGEIAEELGLSTSGVKSRIQRGRSRLRADLLSCCEFEFDRFGGVLEYRRRRRRDGGSDLGASCAC